MRALVVVFGVNSGYTLLSSVMAIYGEQLAGSSAVGGYAVTAFTAAALITRLFIKKLNARFEAKQLLLASMGVTCLATLGYLLIPGIVPFMACRALHGAAFGIALTCAVSIANEMVPASRLAEGISFSSTATTLASALGPSVALEILGPAYARFGLLFAVSFGLAVVSTVLAALLPHAARPQTPAQEQDSSDAASASRGNVVAGILFALVWTCATCAHGIVNTFLTSYAADKGIAGAGLFFTIVAAITVLTRIAGGAIFNRVPARVLVIACCTLFGGSVVALPHTGSLAAVVVVGYLVVERVSPRIRAAR